MALCYFGFSDSSLIGSSFIFRKVINKKAYVFYLEFPAFLAGSYAFSQQHEIEQASGENDGKCSSS